MRFAVRESWNQLSFQHELRKLYLLQDSIYSKFLEVASLRYELEATNYLEKAAAEAKAMEVKNALSINNAEIKSIENQLNLLLNDTVAFSYVPLLFSEYEIGGNESALVAHNPMLQYVQQQVRIAQAEKKVESAKMLPDLFVGYFNQSMIGSETSSGTIAGSGSQFSGVQAGISIPLFYGSYKAKIKMASLNEQIAKTDADYYASMLQSQLDQQFNLVLKNRGSLDYYQNQAVPQSNLILNNAQKSFAAGAINYIEYFQNIQQALGIQFKHLGTLKDYQSIGFRIRIPDW